MKYKTIQIPDVLHERLKIIAIKRHKTMQQLTRIMFMYSLRNVNKAIQQDNPKFLIKTVRDGF